MGGYVGRCELNGGILIEGNLSFLDMSDFRFESAVAGTMTAITHTQQLSILVRLEA